MVRGGHHSEDSSDTLLTGTVADQAVWITRKVRDFGMPLLSVNRLGSGHGRIRLSYNFLGSGSILI
jgi:hypothetical protein